MTSLRSCWVLLPVALLAACAARRANPPMTPEPEPAVITESGTAAPAASAGTMPDRPKEPPAATAPDRPPPPPPRSTTDASGKPAQTGTGTYRISIASTDSTEAAEKWVKKAQDAGYRAEVVAFDVDGKTWQRVLLPGYESLADAQAALPFVQQDVGAADAWVTSRRRAGTEVGAAPPPAEEKPAN